MGNSGIFDTPKLSLQNVKATKAMKYMIVSLELSTLEGYVRTVLQHHTKSRCHYDALSICTDI